jgi:hypothetical protein
LNGSCFRYGVIGFLLKSPEKKDAIGHHKDHITPSITGRGKVIYLLMKLFSEE